MPRDAPDTSMFLDPPTSFPLNKRSGTIVELPDMGPLRGKIAVLVVWVLFAACAVFSAAEARAATPSTEAAGGPQSRPAVISRPGLELDLARGLIRLEGRFAIEEGVIELVACHGGSKAYESLLSMEVQPHDLHFALLLLKLTPGGYLGEPRVPTGSSAISGNVDGAPEKGEEGPPTPAGPKLFLAVEYEKDGELVRCRPESFIWNTKENRAMEKRAWIFTGSRMVRDPRKNESVYWGDLTGALIATLTDPSSVINNPDKYRDDDAVYIVYKEKVPKQGTKATLMISADEKALRAYPNN